MAYNKLNKHGHLLRYYSLNPCYFGIVNVEKSVDNFL